MSVKERSIITANNTAKYNPVYNPDLDLNTFYIFLQPGFPPYLKPLQFSPFQAKLCS